MQTISKRIIEIKKQLDELEGHVNSTLSILDCQKAVLNEYPKDWKEFKWRSYSSLIPYGNQWIHIFKTEEETLDAIDKYKIIFEEIHAKNEHLIQKNTETFNKIRAFLINLGFSTTTYAYSGTGKRRRSYQVDTEWVVHLRKEYPMVDVDFNSFMEWYKREVEEIKKFFWGIREVERIKQLELEERTREAEELAKQLEEQTKSINMATEYLIAHGKIAGRDFQNDTAIDCAFKLKMELLNNPKKAEETEVVRPKTINALDRMEL